MLATVDLQTFSPASWLLQKRLSSEARMKHGCELGRSSVYGGAEPFEPFECYRRYRIGIRVFAGYFPFRNDVGVIAPFAPCALAKAGFVRRTNQDVSLAAARLDGHGDRIEILNGAC